MKTSTIVFCFVFALFFPSYGQYAELIGKPYHLKLQAIHDFYEKAIENQLDSAHAYALIDGLRQAALSAGESEAAMEADLAEALFDLKKSNRKDKMRSMVGAGKEHDVMHITCRATHVLALYDWNRQEYEQAFRGYASLDSLLQQVSVIEFPTKTEYLNDLGYANYQFGDYRLAIGYFQQATQDEAHPFYEKAWKHAMNTMGLAYQKMGDLRLSDSCFRQLLKHNRNDVEVWEGITAGNLGHNHFLREEYKEAIPLIKRDIDIAVKYADYGLAAGAAIPLAEMSIISKSMAEAKGYIDSAYAYILRSGQTDRLRLLYPVMNKWHAASGNALLASGYMDSTLVANSRYHEKYSALRMLRASQETMASQREADVQRLQTEAQRQANRRNLIVGSLALCMVLGGFWGYKRRKTAELALKERDFRLLVADRELQDARNQLDGFTRTISEKNALLETYAKADQTAETRALLEELAKQVVLTDADWQRFSTLFGKVYPGFQHRLKTQHPTLTPAEIRCLSMEKLCFSNKEMATLQGISTSTVMATKHRIRKKLGVGTHAEILELVQSI